MVPASRPTVLSVTSGTRNGEIAGYANRSDTVDIIAPGASIVVYNGQAYMVTGTSTAAANVSGAAAALTINTKQAPLQAASGITKLPGFTPAKKP
jgi:subtilisin family serine protease